MGGVMYAGKKYVSTAQEAFSKRKKTDRFYTDAAEKLTQQAAQDWQKNLREETYIFRSAAEKNRALYQAAREQLAAEQALLAKRGITQNSATAQLLSEKAQLKAALQQDAAAKETSSEILQNRQEAQARQTAQRKQISAMHKAGNQKSRLWKIGKQLFSWL